jgi:hypothetical protein
MKEAAARRKWWMWAAPLLIVFAALAVMTVAGAPYTLELAREQAERQLASMPAEQAEMARQGMAASLSQSSMIIAGLVSGLIMLFLGVLAQATFLYFGTLISGGEVQFGSIFTLSAWSRLPFAVHYLTMTAFMAVSQKAIEYQGLGFLVRTGDMFQDMRNPVFNLLSQINIFWLWHLFLIVVLWRAGPGHNGAANAALWWYDGLTYNICCSRLPRLWSDPGPGIRFWLSLNPSPVRSQKHRHPVY